MIYFTADLHFGHQNIIQLKNRPFQNAEEMNEKLIKNINSICSTRDKLVILGDIAFKQKKEKTEEQLSRLSPKLVLIKGNHDTEYDSRLFEGIHEYFAFTAYHRRIILSHYPFLEWDGFFRGSLHLHGHQHNYAEYNDRMRKLSVYRYDVGVDANDYFPVSLKEIFDFFNLSTDDFGNSLKSISFR